jgi:hypothetical protein
MQERGPGGFALLDVACKFCDNIVTMRAIPEDIIEWRQGDELIQDALPYLEADEREILISGMCPKCWLRTFGEE